MTAITAEFKEKLAASVKQTLKSDVDYERLRLTLRRKAQSDLWFFCYHVCGFPDVATKLHVEMCKRWTARMEHKYGLYLIPRSHLKTTLWTVGGTLWTLCQDEVALLDGRIKRGCDLRFLIVNAKLSNAIDILRDIESIILTSEMFGWLFPEYVPDMTWRYGRGKGKWVTDRLDLPCSKQAGRKEGNMEIMSVGASLVSKHYDFILFDDPVNDENVTTKVYRDKLDVWYKNAQQLREDPISSRVRLIGTRWHFDDLYGRIIKREAAFRQRQKDDGKRVTPVYFLYRRKAIEEGEPIWPERFTQESLDFLKLHELGSYIYSCQYDNNPLPEEDATFKRSQIQYIDDFLVPDGCVNFAAIDLADEDTTRGDFTVITVASFDEDGNMYIRQVDRGKYTNYEIITKVNTLTKQWDLQRVGCETTGFQKNVFRGYKHETEKRGWWIPWIEITRGKTSKFKRALGLQPRVERGDFYIVNDISNHEWLIEEMTTFPLGVHDDILDTVVDLENIYYNAPKRVYEHTATNTYDAIFGSIIESGDDPENYDPLNPEYLRA